MRSMLIERVIGQLFTDRCYPRWSYPKLRSQLEQICQRQSVAVWLTLRLGLNEAASAAIEEGSQGQAPV